MNFKKLGAKIRKASEDITRTIRRPSSSSSSANNRFSKIGDISQTAIQRTTAFLQKKDLSFYGKGLTLILCAFFLSDLTSLLISRFIPEPTSIKDSQGIQVATSTQKDFDVVVDRNLFNSKGLVPEERDERPKPADNTPVKTSLPLELIGTIIFKERQHSMATINDRSANKVYAVRQGDEIPNRIKIEEVLERKVIFVNLRNFRKEYVDLPEDIKFKAAPIARSAPPPQKEIQAAGPKSYIIPRNEIDEAVSDLSKILTQARVVPHFKNGAPSGFKIFQIVPGSIYDKLGLKNGDILVGINGEPIDPSKAFTMLQELKNMNNVEVAIERSGSPQVFNYDIQ